MNTVHDDNVSNSMDTVDNDSGDTGNSLDTVAFVRTMGIDVISSNNSSPGGDNNMIVFDPMDIISPGVDEVLDLSSAGGHALIENNVYFTKPKEVIPVNTDGVLDLSIKGKALYTSTAVEALEESTAEVQTNLEMNKFVHITEAVEETEVTSEGSAIFCS